MKWFHKHKWVEKGRIEKSERGPYPHHTATIHQECVCGARRNAEEFIREKTWLSDGHLGPPETVKYIDYYTAIVKGRKQRVG